MPNGRRRREKIEFYYDFAIFEVHFLRFTENFCGSLAIFSAGRPPQIRGDVGLGGRLPTYALDTALGTSRSTLLADSLYLYTNRFSLPTDYIAVKIFCS